MPHRYRIQSPNGTSFEAEGDVTEWKGKRVMLDGQGKPWLLLTEQDVLSPQEPSAEKQCEPSTKREENP
jgi:hypothetical protein